VISVWTKEKGFEAYTYDLPWFQLFAFLQETENIPYETKVGSGRNPKRVLVALTTYDRGNGQRYSIY
jgi:hypothetical protein